MVDLDYSGQVNAHSEPEETTHPGNADPVAVPRGTETMAGNPGPLLRLIRDQRVAFLLVGATNTAIGYVWFVVFQLTVGALAGHYGYLATLACAHVASVLCAFVLYRRFVFRVRGHVLRDLGRFELVYLVALAVNYAALPLLVEFAHLTPILAQTVIVVVTTLVSWFGHRRFSFRRSARDEAAAAMRKKK
jgi:putative flippase GtrA